MFTCPFPPVAVIQVPQTVVESKYLYKGPKEG